MEKDTPVLTKYAIPCMQSDGEVFFIAFNTRDEEEASRLASCVSGQKGRRCMVIINENGEIYYI